jgi:hypothetical protein
MFSSDCVLIENLINGKLGTKTDIFQRRRLNAFSTFRDQ